MASGIIELPLHHPVLLARQLASIDQISQGRLIVGVGAGYLDAEFAAMGVDLADRGVRMNERIDAMRALWTMDQPQYSGRIVQIHGVNAYPRPVRIDRDGDAADVDIGRSGGGGGGGGGGFADEARGGTGCSRGQ